MRAMMLVGSASLIGGGAYVGGAFDRGEYYPIAPTTVESRLANLDFGEDARDAEAGLVLRSRGPAVVRWDLMMAGRRIADVRAHLAPESAGTRVDIEFAFTANREMMGLDQDAFLNDVAEIAMEEKVDSTLDGRPFDENRLRAKLIAAVAADPKAFAAFQKKFKAAQSGDALAEAYSDRDYQRPGTVRPTASAKPMTSAKPSAPEDFGETHEDGGWGKTD